MAVRDICGFGVRHLQCFLIFLTFTIFYMQGGVSHCILIMISFSNENLVVHREERISSNRFSLGIMCLERILQMICAIAAGIWSVHKGVKYLILALGVVGTVMMYTIHLFVEAYGWPVLVIMDVAFSIGRAFLEPLLYSLLTKWIPYNEKSRLVQIIFPGKLLGFLLEHTVGLYLGKPQDEWAQMLFWTGNCSVLWVIAWCAFGADHPRTCFYIDRNERKYIQEHQPHTTKHSVRKTIPWSKIFLTAELYPLIFTHVCVEWCYQVAYSHLDLYFIYVYNFDMEAVSSLLGYGHLAALMIAFPIGFIADKLPVSKYKIAPSKVRKVSTCIGLWGGGATLTFLGRSGGLMVSKFMAGLFIVFTVPVHMGFYLTYMDYSPNYGGMLFGIGSCFAYFITLWVPAVRSALIKDNSNIVGWNQFLYTTSLANYLGGLIYGLYTSADVKLFNKVASTKLGH